MKKSYLIKKKKYAKSSKKSNLEHDSPNPVEIVDELADSDSDSEHEYEYTEEYNQT